MEAKTISKTALELTVKDRKLIERIQKRLASTDEYGARQTMTMVVRRGLSALARELGL